MSILLVNSDSLHIPLADKSVQCVVTSPPYWGLRDYGVQDQLGLEPTPEAYVADMVAVFREIWRVLRDDGTCWMNLGDSYWNGGAEKRDGGHGFVDCGKPKLDLAKGMLLQGKSSTEMALKPKDLVGIPWRVAFALQSDGWYLRSDIIWHKPNPMPESVTDRPTKAHEYVFLLTKSARYFYDNDAVSEPAAYAGDDRGSRTDSRRGTDCNSMSGKTGSTRNLRTVWTIATQPTPFAHFATYPEKLVEPCIKAGTSERGRCPNCGKAWERVTERGLYNSNDDRPDNGMPGRTGNGLTRKRAGDPTSTTTGWQPTCSCNAGEPVPCIVLDPFAGSGTTGLVARRLGRHFVGLDLSRTYLHTIARRRLELDKLDDWSNGIQAQDNDLSGFPLFQEANQ